MVRIRCLIDKANKMISVGWSDADEERQVNLSRRFRIGKAAVEGFARAALWCAFSLFAIPITLAQANEQSVSGTSSLETQLASDEHGTGAAEVGAARRPEVGMSLQEALALVGSSPDSEEEVGAACGMLDVLTWDGDGTKIISVDGTVTSIVKGTKQEP